MKLFKTSTTKKLSEVDIFNLAVNVTVPTLIKTKGATLSEEDLVEAVKNVYSALKTASDSL